MKQLYNSFFKIDFIASSFLIIYPMKKKSSSSITIASNNNALVGFK
jgi:hypothetical protein